MNILHNESLREQLAAEYVLGTLKGGARRRFESWMNDDAALRRAVSEWQDRIYPLAEMTAEVHPSLQVWMKIEKRVDVSMLRQSDTQDKWLKKLYFWRGLSIASLVMSLSLIAFISLRQSDTIPSKPNYVALLVDKNSRTGVIVTGGVSPRQLSVKIVIPQSVTSSEDLQLWALPKQGTPRSLGLLLNNGEVVLALPSDVLLDTIPTLAVSLERKGGSPNPNGPTGPVLLNGDLLKI